MIETLEIGLGIGVTSWIGVLIFKNKIFEYILRHCNKFFFDRFFLEENDETIVGIVNKCKTLFEEIEESKEDTLKLSLENTIFFSYFHIHDSGDCSIYIGPVAVSTQNKEIVKPFICYNKKTENMGLADIKNKIFFLTLWKDQKQ